MPIDIAKRQDRYEQVVAAFLGWMEDRQLLEAGRKAEIADDLRAAFALLECGRAARDEVARNPDGDYARRLRERTRRKP